MHSRWVIRECVPAAATSSPGCSHSSRRETEMETCHSQKRDYAYRIQSGPWVARWRYRHSRIFPVESLGVDVAIHRGTRHCALIDVGDDDHSRGSLLAREDEARMLFEFAVRQGSFPVAGRLSCHVTLHHSHPSIQPHSQTVRQRNEAGG